MGPLEEHRYARKESPKRMKRSSNTYCSVPQCSNYVRAGISFHRFPLAQEVRSNKWAHALKLGKRASKGMTVCSEHFLDTDYHHGQIKRRLKFNAIPSRNLPTDLHDQVSFNEKTQSFDYRADGRRRKAQAQASTKQTKRFQDVANDPVPKTKNLAEGKEAVSLAAEALLELQSAIEEEPLVILPQFSDALTQVPFTNHLAEELLEIQLAIKKEPLAVLPQFTDTACQVSFPSCLQKTSLMDMIKSDADLNAFTGIQSMGLLKAVTETAEMIETSGGGSKKSQLNLSGKIVLSMAKMKLNLSFRCLSVLFGLSITTCVRYFNDMLVLLSNVLSDVNVGPERDAFRSMLMVFNHYQEHANTAVSRE